jgi:SpoIID/LytB domain protein
VRRWLLQSLKANGYNLPYLDGSIVSQKPQITFSIKGVTYQLQQLEIATTKKIVQLVRGEDRQRVKIYPGNLKIQPNAYGTFTIVNEVPLEAYLRGVIPHEIGPEAPKNAVEAQTIIARTYALRNLRRFSADNYQLCATQHCQVYEGWTGTNSIADRAIASTKGIVLTYQNQLVDALYSSTTGGITAPFSDIWNGEERPYLKAIIDAPTQVWNLSRQNLANEESFRNFISMQTGFNETGRKVFRWRRENNLEELNKDLRDYLERIKSPLVNFTTIQKIEIVERSPSGRVLKTIVSTDKGSVELFKSENRSAFSSLASTLFYLEPLYNEDKTLKGYAFIGGGFGHGVGFSQFGSYNLAKLGWSAKRILSFYYPGTKIQSLTSLTANSQF